MMAMLKWVLLLQALLLGTFLKAQQTPNWGQQIEKVYSVASLQQLMIQLSPTWPIDLDSLEANDKESYCAKCHVTMPPVWAKADFDGDGRPDLLVNGTIGRNVVVLNRGNSWPEIITLPLMASALNCNAMSVVYRHGRALIRGREIQYVRERARARGYKPHKLRYLLMYKGGAFMDFVTRPKRQMPTQLYFFYSTGGPPAPGHLTYSVSLNLATGAVTSEVRKFGTAGQGPFQYQLCAGTRDTLRQRLHYLRLRRRHYARDVFDGSHHTLELIYASGRRREVTDYGQAAPHSLQAIFDLLSVEQRRKMAEIERAGLIPIPSGR